ncbi:hypothetical protein NQ318_022119 [Aromia moschata]|uniref:EF-hand domain-containing protein n=1 Tax=Aromia moschata TaxID=1265417 RepID=A0AAV8Z7C1_9CUCU|nr:hypothetical protein NQ318_022119 [Aromia moschata]
MMHGFELRQQEDIKASSKRKVNAVHAAPSSTIPDQPPQTEVTSVLSNIFGVLCGVLCKDTPLAEIIPAPTQTAPLNTSFVEVGLEGFSKDICRSMVAMLDADRSGRLGYHEFKKLWIAIRTWKNAWLMYDIDRSGTFSGFELREALNSAGYRLNTHVLNILMHRFGNKRGEIHFDDFMMCAIKLKTMIDLFMEKDKLGTDSATFSMEEWLECTLYS